MLELTLEPLCMAFAVLTNGALDMLETVLCDELVDANDSPDAAPVIALDKAVACSIQPRYLPTSCL